jgi:hypothetical protein
MDVDADKEALFNEVYDTDHVPLISKVPGVRAASRIQGEPFTMQLAGQTVKKEHEGPRYTAIYEIDSPAVLLSKEWGQFAEEGRWPSEVRPFTRNRRHAIYKVRGSDSDGPGHRRRDAGATPEVFHAAETSRRPADTRLRA